MADPAVVMDRTIDVPGPEGAHPLRYSSRLVRTLEHLPLDYQSAEPDKADFYDALKVAAVLSVAAITPIVPSSALETQYIEAQAGFGAGHLTDVEELKMYFAGNDETWLVWNTTSTALRFRPKDVNKNYAVGDTITVERIETDITRYLRQIADPKFTRDNWKDIIDNVNHVRGELAVPYARGQVIRRMRHGIFTEVEPTTVHTASSYALHAWLRENLDVPRDPISGHHDLAVGRGSGWPLDEGCLYVDAYYGRWDASSDVGFRPVVWGSGSEIEM